MLVVLMMFLIGCGKDTDTDADTDVSALTPSSGSFGMTPEIAEAA